MIRTQEEIVARFKSREDQDPLGFEVFEYIPFMDFEHAKPYIKDEVTKEEWAKYQMTDPRKSMIEYMPFAWEKANGCRGISAQRSLSHYQAWLWLDGAPDAWVDGLFDDYIYYGKPQLVEICEYLRLDHKQWDDGVRTNVG